MTALLTFYSHPMSRGRTVRAMLEECGAAYDTVLLDYGTTMKALDYLAINPMGKVPALIIDGKPLTENVAIQVWIDRQFPQAGLMPTDPMAYAQALSVMAWCAAGMHPKITQQARPARYCSNADMSANVRALGSQGLLEQFAVADKMLAGREWFFDDFSCADAHFYWCFRRGTQFKPDTSVFTHCMAHKQRMEQRPSVQKLLAYEAQVQAVFAAA